MSKRIKLDEVLSTAKTLVKIIQSGIDLIEEQEPEFDVPIKSELLQPTTSLHDNDVPIVANALCAPPTLTFKEGFLVVYTHASCINGNNGIGVWFGDNIPVPINVSTRCLGKTSYAAAILACIEACKVAKSTNCDKLEINTTSEYVFKCMTLWIESWKRNGWKKIAGEDVANQEELVLLDYYSKKLNVTFKYVTDGKGFDAAKKLADEGTAKSAF